MTNTLKFAGIAVAGIVVGLLLSALLHPASFGGVYQNSLSVGPNGTQIAQVLKGTCNLIGTNASQAASSTLAYDCAVTGVKSGDTVFAQLASSTPVGGAAGWSISATLASSTNGYITVLLVNRGVAAVPSATHVGSSTQYLIVR